MKAGSCDGLGQDPWRISPRDDATRTGSLRAGYSRSRASSRTRAALARIRCRRLTKFSYAAGRVPGPGPGPGPDRLPCAMTIRLRAARSLRRPRVAGLPAVLLLGLLAAPASGETGPPALEVLLQRLVDLPAARATALAVHHPAHRPQVQLDRAVSCLRPHHPLNPLTVPTPQLLERPSVEHGLPSAPATGSRGYDHP